MTTTEPSTRQRFDVGVHLDPDSFAAQVRCGQHGQRPPIASVELIDGLRVQADNVDTLLAAADAFQDAARQLRTAQINASLREMIRDVTGAA